MDELVQGAFNCIDCKRGDPECPNRRQYRLLWVQPCVIDIWLALLLHLLVGPVGGFVQLGIRVPRGLSPVASCPAGTCRH